MRRVWVCVVVVVVGEIKLRINFSSSHSRFFYLKQDKRALQRGNLLISTVLIITKNFHVPIISRLTCMARSRLLIASFSNDDSSTQITCFFHIMSLNMTCFSWTTAMHMWLASSSQSFSSSSAALCLYKKLVIYI